MIRSTLILGVLLLGCGDKGDDDGAILRVDHRPSPRPSASPAPTPAPTNLEDSGDWAVARKLCTLSSTGPCGEPRQEQEDACLTYYLECLVNDDLSTCVEQEK
jgi:hypothetical protein